MTMTQAALMDLKERIAISTDFTAQERTFILDAVNEAADLAGAERHEPRNYLGRIDHIWAFLSIDEGGEGVCAAPFGALTLPLVAADKRRVDDLIPVAKKMARTFGKPIRLAKFTKREDVEVYQP